ncbi:MAG: VOC family protein [bacterium]
MPPSIVIPVLGYPDVHVAAEWLFRAFGFTERLRMGDHRIQLDAGGGSLVITQMAGVLSGRCAHSVMVRVVDANAHAEHAGKAGARIVLEPADYPYGERQYSAEDLAGHQWTFSQSIADIDPASWGGSLVSDPE